jgi:hypothetical protein
LSGDFDGRFADCTAVKAQGIMIYTVQVNTGGPADPTSSVLQYCQRIAELPGHLGQPDAEVFNSIGTSLSKLRVAR